MKLLPSEQREKKAEMLEELEENGELTLREPCDCGAQIRHNNGGNYHEIITIKQDSGRWFIKFSDTCELTPPAEWRETDMEKIEEVIESRLSSW